LKACSVINTFS